MRKDWTSVDLKEMADGRWSEEEAQQMLAQWRESGLSLTAFARRHGLQTQRLCFWKKRLGEEPVRLLPATVAMVAPVALRLPDATTIEVSVAVVQPEWVAALVRELRK
jgi:transposase-like protein